jgi:8-oxo-dGTP pyrophosphatase MutT (NUDIX family)
MREIKISLIALRRGDEYFMHKRSGDPARGAAGSIGFIGGEFEPKEDRTYLNAAIRETCEETGVILPADRIKKIGKVTVNSDRDNQPARIKAVGFSADLPFDTEIALFDPRDEPVTATTGEIIEEYLGKSILTPATEALFIRHIMKGVIYRGDVDY